MRTFVAVCAGLTALIFSSVLVAENNLLDSAAQIYSFNRILRVSVSGDMQKSAFITYTVKKSGEIFKPEFTLYVKDGSQTKTIATSSKPIKEVQWSPASDEIAYVIEHAIWIDNLKTNSINKWIDFHGNVGTLRWAPNGQAIAFTAQKEKEKTDLPIDVSKDYVNARLYIGSVQSGEAKPLTPESMSVSSQFDFSPDGQSIVIAHQPRNPMEMLNDSSLALVNIKSGVISSLMQSKGDTTYLTPFYSPNGEWITYETNIAPTGQADMLTHQYAILFTRVCVVNVKTKISHCLKNTFNESPQLIGWNASSQSVYVMDAEKIEGMKIYALPIDGVASPILVSQKIGIVSPYTLTLNSSHTAFGFSYETVSQPPEAYMSRTNPFALQKISDVNVHVNSAPLGTERVIHWASSDGKIIEGLLIMPPDYNPKKSYPLYVNLHGGPYGSDYQRYLGDCHDFGTKLPPTECVAPILREGFVVFEPNPRGSNGYGYQFAISVVSDWGGHDYDDIMSGVDYLIHQHIVDPNHLAISGWSYGGYMSAWAVTQTHRFKVAIDGEGPTDLISVTGTCDIPMATVAYLGSYFWDNNEIYLKRAPIMHVKNVTTPLLIFEGSNDTRVPPGQAYEMYTALHLQKKPVKLFILPNQEHIPTNPTTVVYALAEILKWLKSAEN